MIRTWHIILLLIVFFSCKKEEEAVYPVIVTELPIENTIYTSGDTVTIKGKVTHIKPLTQVSVVITDISQIPVTPRFSLTPSGNDYVINTQIIINNPELPSGNYYLNVRAGDGILETNHFVKIYIQEAPLNLEHIFVIAGNTTGGTDIFRMDTSLNMVLMANTTGDFGYAVSDGVNKRLYITGLFSSRIKCYDYSESTWLWEQQVPGFSPQPYFTDAALKNKVLYLGIRQQAVMAYNSSGTLVFNLPTPADRYPSLLHFHGDYMLTAQSLLSGQQASVMLYYRESGALLQSVPASMNTLAFYSKDQNNIFVFGNDFSGQAQIRIYDMEANGLWEPYNLTSGTINSVAQIDNNTYLIGTNDRILKYTYNPSGAINWLNDTDITGVYLEPSTQRVLTTTSDNKIKVYSYPQATLLAETSITGTLKKVVFGYNRPY